LQQVQNSDDTKFSRRAARVKILSPVAILSKLKYRLQLENLFLLLFINRVKSMGCIFCDTHHRFNQSSYLGWLFFNIKFRLLGFSVASLVSKYATIGR